MSGHLHNPIRVNRYQRMSVYRMSKLRGLSDCIRLGFDPRVMTMITDGGDVVFDREDYFNYMQENSSKFDIEVTNVATTANNG